MTTATQANGKATKTKEGKTLTYSVSIAINATPEQLWQIITNAAHYTKWNTTLTSVEGTIAVGNTIKLKAKVAGNRVFALKVAEMEENRRMVWKSGNVMFKGVRTYTLTPQANGITVFTMSEVYSGLMLGMIAGSLPDFTEAFEQFAADLKKEAEK